MGLLTSFVFSATLFLNLPDQHLRLTSQNAITSWHTEVLPCEPGAYQLTGEVRTVGEPLIDGGALIRVTFPSYTPVPWHAATTFPEVTNGKWHRFRLPFWAPSKVKDIKVEGIFRYVAGTAEFRNLKIERFAEVTPYRAFAETSSIKINETRQ